MRWFFAITLLVGSSLYLLDRYKKLNAQPPPAAAPPVASAPPVSTMFLTVAEIKKIKRAVKDPDPGVRWAALEFLFNVRDPDAVELLSKTVADDYDPDIRLKAIDLLKTAQNVPIIKLQGLIKALSDLDPALRIAALKAIGDIGDANAVPWVADTLKDYDPEVRAQALQTIGQFQDKRKQEFEAMAEKLRADYEAAVKKSREQQEQ